MKKLLALILALALLPCAALAEATTDAPAQAEVYVSITDGEGALVLACLPVIVTDADGDGALTIHDALAAAHAAHHPEGAEAFSTAKTEFGLSMVKLWGVDNGGSYGYCLNDASAWSLADPVKDGDHVKAYAYTDLIAWSDTYCYFDAPMMTAAAGEEIPLTLSAAGYDEMWNPVTLPVEGADITVNGKAADVITDAQGRAVLTFAEPGVYVVSAVSQHQTLVAPVCVITVTEGE